MKTGQVTYAVRDTHIDDKEIHEGDIMGIGDSGILAVGQSVEETTKEMLHSMGDEDTELISLYYGQDVQEESAENFAQEIEDLYPDVDVDVHSGGQQSTIMYFLLSKRTVSKETEQQHCNKIRNRPGHLGKVFRLFCLGDRHK